LQILDDGRVTDARGKEVKFDNCIIVMTTNAGSSTGTNPAGFGMQAGQMSQARTEKALSEFLRPEFINRVDEIITFRQLDKNDFVKIAAIMIGDLRKAVAERGLDIVCTDAALEYIAENSFSSKFGARNMRRFITRNVEDPAAEQIIDAKGENISVISVDVKDGKLDVKVK
jgi:ATP-dependent Clp protease ATP-binding subunit ClpA